MGFAALMGFGQDSAGSTSARGELLIIMRCTAMPLSLSPSPVVSELMRAMHAKGESTREVWRLGLSSSFKPEAVRGTGTSIDSGKRQSRWHIGRNEMSAKKDREKTG